MFTFWIITLPLLPIFLDKIPNPTIDEARLSVDILDIFVDPHMGHLGLEDSLSLLALLLARIFF